MRDDTLYASRSYLTVNADGLGDRELQFPDCVDLFDPFTGHCPARRVKVWPYSFQDKETLVLRYSRP
jgi:hypothetical protein